MVAIRKPQRRQQPKRRVLLGGRVKEHHAVKHHVLPHGATVVSLVRGGHGGVVEFERPRPAIRKPARLSK
ncbi:MAG TPA: hypothetical protein VJA40_00285 [archaeon]|nr:hypothetical protein [archaeon]